MTIKNILQDTINIKHLYSCFHSAYLSMGKEKLFPKKGLLYLRTDILLYLGWLCWQIGLIFLTEQLVKFSHVPFVVLRSKMQGISGTVKGRKRRLCIEANSKVIMLLRSKECSQNRCKETQNGLSPAISEEQGACTPTISGKWNHSFVYFKPVKFTGLNINFLKKYTVISSLLLILVYCFVMMA